MMQPLGERGILVVRNESVGGCEPLVRFMAASSHHCAAINVENLFRFGVAPIAQTQLSFTV